MKRTSFIFAAVFAAPLLAPAGAAFAATDTPEPAIGEPVKSEPVKATAGKQKVRHIHGTNGKHARHVHEKHSAV